MISEIKGYAKQTSPSRVSEGAQVALRLMREGSLSVASFLQAMIFEGLGYSAFEGAFSTEAAGGGAAAVIDIDRPNMTLGVPDKTSIMLFRVTSQAFMPLTVTDDDEAEILLGVHVGTKITVASATALTPRNLKTGVAAGSLIDAEKTHATNIATAPTVDMELARAVARGEMAGTPANAAWEQLVLNYEPLVIPVIKGPSTVLLYHGGTVATDGFTQMFWVELPTSDV